MGINFEYTAPSAQQYDGHIEQKFGMPFNCIWTMLNDRKFSGLFRNILWAEKVPTAFLLENNLMTSKWILSPFQQFFGKGKRSILPSLQKFGEICVVTFYGNTH